MGGPRNAGIVTFIHQVITHYQVVILGRLVGALGAVMAACELGDGRESDRVIVVSGGR